MRKEKTSCILIGGFAVNFHKVSRTTADVDFLITKQDFDKISDDLNGAGYKELSRHENFAHFQSPRAGLVGVDFMFVDQATFEKIRQEGQKIRVGKNEFVVPSLLHLIALKLHSMKFNLKDRLAKDFPDVIGLIRTNNINIYDKHFKESCLKYGSEEIYQRILEVLK
jgi:hypothetical protein